MLVIAWNSREVSEVQTCKPQYSPILDKMLGAGVLEVRTVDERGRLGAWVAGPDGDPLWVPVDTHPMDLRYVLPGPGRHAVVARDHQGRHLGRNDVFAREAGHAGPRPITLDRALVALGGPGEPPGSPRPTPTEVGRPSPSSSVAFRRHRRGAGGSKDQPGVP